MDKLWAPILAHVRSLPLPSEELDESMAATNDVASSFQHVPQSESASAAVVSTLAAIDEAVAHIDDIEIQRKAEESWNALLDPTGQRKDLDSSVETNFLTEFRYHLVNALQRGLLSGEPGGDSDLALLQDYACYEEQRGLHSGEPGGDPDLAHLQDFACYEEVTSARATGDLPLPCSVVNSVGLGPASSCGGLVATRFPKIRAHILDDVPKGVRERITDDDIERALQRSQAWPVFPASTGFSREAPPSALGVPAVPCGVAIYSRELVALGPPVLASIAKARHSSSSTTTPCTSTMRSTSARVLRVRHHYRVSHRLDPDVNARSRGWRPTRRPNHLLHLHLPLN